MDDIPKSTVFRREAAARPATSAGGDRKGVVKGGLILGTGNGGNRRGPILRLILSYQRRVWEKVGGSYVGLDAYDLRIPCSYHLMKMEYVFNDTPVRLNVIYPGIEAQRDTYEKQRSNRCDLNIVFSLSN